MLALTARVTRKGTELPLYFVADRGQARAESRAVLVAWPADGVAGDHGVV